MIVLQSSFWALIWKRFGGPQNKKGPMKFTKNVQQVLKE